jgi:hypothetical protein
MSQRVKRSKAKENNKEENEEIKKAVKVRIDVLNSKIRSKEDMYQLLTGYCKFILIECK